MATPLSQLAAVGQQQEAPQGPQSVQSTLASFAPQPTLPQAPSQSGDPIAQSYFERLTNDYEGLKAQYAQLTD
jgi:hypothetical protein